MTSTCIWYPDRHAKKPGNSREYAQLTKATWPQPFEAEYSSDAHFWPYLIYQNDEPTDLQVGVNCFRGKPASMADNEAVKLHYVVLEWDSEDHSEMSPEDRVGFLNQLFHIPETSPAHKISCFYWTRGGARLIYRLADPIDWSEYEAINRGLAFEISKHTGYQCDPTTSQWSRGYRLPKVVRQDGKGNGRSWEQDWFELYTFDTVLDAKDVRRFDGRLPWDNVDDKPLEPVSNVVPDMDAVLAIADAAFKDKAKKLLKGKDCFPYVFEGKQPEPGLRD